MDDPRGGALEEVKRPHPRLDPGHQLNRRGARADHRHTLARELVLVIPSRRMEDGSPEGVDPVDVRQLGVGQAACAGDQELGRQRAGTRVDPPQLLGRVPVRGGHLVAVADVRVDAVFA